MPIYYRQRCIIIYNSCLINHGNIHHLCLKYVSNNDKQMYFVFNIPLLCFTSFFISMQHVEDEQRSKIVVTE